MSLAGIITGMGSPIDDASRQARAFSDLQTLSDAQVRAEQERLQRMRNEQYQQELMRPVEGPEDLAGSAPAGAVSFAAPQAQPEPAAPAAPRAPAVQSGARPPAAKPEALDPRKERALQDFISLRRQRISEMQRTLSNPSLPPRQREILQENIRREQTLMAQSEAELAKTSPATIARRNSMAARRPAAPAPFDESTGFSTEPTVAAPAAPASAPAMPDFNALAEAVKMVESRGDPTAVSEKGAVGTMQTMPTTLTKPGYGVRPAQDDSDAERERVGRDYLQAMLREYNGNLYHALAAYNWGPGNVDKWIAAGADPAKLPKETREYIPKVMARLGGQPDAAATPGAPTAAAPATPAMQFSPEQVTRISNAVQQDLRVKQLQLAEINRLLAAAPDMQTAQNLRSQANEIRFGAFQAQLLNASAQALSGDERAVAQLANAARVQYAQTQQGYVPVQMGPDGQYQAVGEPRSREDFVNALFSEASGAAQRARDAQNAELFKARAQIAVEGAKTEGTLLRVQAEAQAALQKLIAERSLQADDVQDVEFDPMGRTPPMMRTKKGVYMLQMPQNLGGGVKTDARWVLVE